MRAIVLSFGLRSELVIEYLNTIVFSCNLLSVRLHSWRWKIKKRSPDTLALIHGKLCGDEWTVWLLLRGILCVEIEISSWIIVCSDAVFNRKPSELTKHSRRSVLT